RRIDDGVARRVLCPWLPLDFHCHGIGGIDFSEIEAFDGSALSELERGLASSGVEAVLTVYLLREQVAAFERLLGQYRAMRESGTIRHIRGFAVEGPLLGSAGGTPHRATWAPS